MWTGVLWAGPWVAMWITHLGGKFRHGLLEKSLNNILSESQTPLRSCVGDSLVVGRLGIQWCFHYELRLGVVSPQNIESGFSHF